MKIITEFLNRCRISKRCLCSFGAVGRSCYNSKRYHFETDYRDCIEREAAANLAQYRRSAVLLFRDLKPYMQIGKNCAVVKGQDWSSEIYEFRREILEKYDNMHVYGIGMEDHPWVEEYWRAVDYETMHKKRMVIVLSGQS